MQAPNQEEQEPELEEHQRTTISTLPLELQIEILSYLPFTSQISASILTTQWHHLLSQKPFLNSRYFSTPNPSKSIPRGIHRLLKPDETHPSFFGCSITRHGNIRRYFMLIRDPEPQVPIFTQNISTCQYLSDPLFSPVCLEDMELKEYMRTFKVHVEFNSVGLGDEAKGKKLGGEFTDLEGINWLRGKKLEDVKVKEMVWGVIDGLVKRVEEDVPQGRRYRLMFVIASFGVRVVVIVGKS
ncbi:hypothetical protein TWF281_009806 [Arthrobotrys megalospora]